MSKNIAYLRISTLEQDNSKNKTDILSLANEKGLGKVEFVEDKFRGKSLGASKSAGQAHLYFIRTL